MSNTQNEHPQQQQYQQQSEQMPLWAQQMTAMIVNAITQVRSPVQEPPTIPETPDTEEKPDSQTLYRRRPALEDPIHFEGNRAEYDTWRTQLKAKLEVDGYLIGNDRTKFLYVNSRLKGRAAKLVHTFVESTMNTPLATPTNFLSYLDTVFGDTNKQERAGAALRTLQQGKLTFAQFLPKFERLLADAGGATWPNFVKINYLKGCLNHALLDRMVCVVDAPADYPGYVATLMKVSGQEEALQLSKTRAMYRRAAVASPQDPNAMDWEPTTTTRVSAAATSKSGQKTAPATTTNVQSNGKRAKWVDQTIYDKRRTENRCLRCGKQDCRIARCPYLPPIRPAEAKTYAAASSSSTIQNEATGQKGKAPVVDELSDSDNDGEEEKD